jgi:phosphohistidine phosphatase
MLLYLVHHGDAVGAEVDPQRPLSDRGREEVDRLARTAAARSVKPAVIWHSGKLRARQTAEAFWRHCNPLAEFHAARGLQPSDPPGPVVTMIGAETRDLLLVGHMPGLPRILQTLVRAPESVGFPIHGLVAVEREGEGWIERWREGLGTG